MNTREAFKAGFLFRCAELGLTGPQVAERLQKAAALVEKQALGWGDLANTVIGKSQTVANAAGGLGLAAAVGLPIAAGFGVAHLADEAASPEVDEDDIRKQELIDEYRNYARRARDRQQAATLHV